MRDEKLNKSHVKAKTRVEKKTGKVVQVRSYDDSRSKKAPKKAIAKVATPKNVPDKITKEVKEAELALGTIKRTSGAAKEKAKARYEAAQKRIDSIIKPKKAVKAKISTKKTTLQTPDPKPLKNAKPTAIATKAKKEPTKSTKKTRVVIEAPKKVAKKTLKTDAIALLKHAGPKKVATKSTKATELKVAATKPTTKAPSIKKQAVKTDGIIPLKHAAPKKPGTIMIGSPKAAAGTRPTAFMDKPAKRIPHQVDDKRLSRTDEEAAPNRNWFPPSESHLEAMEPKRHAMVRAGDKVDVSARKALETQYLKTWNPMLKRLASDAIRDIGLTPRVNDAGQPEGIYADFHQEANLEALKALRIHDPKQYGTGLRDLVRGNVRRHLFERWRSIIGAYGDTRSRTNGELTKLSKVAEDYRQTHGEAPSEEALAEAMKKTVEEVKHLKKTALTIANDYLDRRIEDGDGNSASFGDMVASASKTPEQMLTEHDFHDRVGHALEDAIKSHVKDPRAKLALSLELGFPHLIDRHAKGIIADHKLDDLSRKAMQAEVNFKKVTKKSATAGDVVKYIGSHPAFAGRSDDSKVSLIQNLKSHHYDPMSLLTEGYDDQGERVARDGSYRNVLAQRMGYSRSAGGKWVADAMHEMSRHEGLKTLRETELEKSFTTEFDHRPAIVIFREIFGMPAPRPVAIEERISIIRGEGLEKALEGMDNAWKVTLHETGMSYWIIPHDVDLEGISKSWGTDLQKQHAKGRWVTIRGRHIFIDEGGHIIAGPKGFVGKHVDDFVNAGAGEHDKEEHSHPENENEHEAQEHTLSHDGKSATFKLHGEYGGMKDGKAKVTLAFHGAKNEHGEAFAADKNGKNKASDVLGHVGMKTEIKDQNGKVVWRKEHGIYSDKLFDPNNKTFADPDKVAKLVEQSRQREEAQNANVAVGKQSHTRRKSEKSATELEEIQHQEEASKFRHNGAHSDDRRTVYSMTTSDGQVRHIKVNNATHRIEGSAMLGQLIGDREIHSEADLQRALSDQVGTKQTVTLSNGKSHYLLNVRHDDATGDPRIEGGKLDGMKLHEVVGKNGGLQQFKDPVEHNGKQLYAGYDNKAGRMTALGNWSKEKAYAHFGAETPEEKAEVDAKLKDAEAKALPPVAHAKANKDGSITVHLPYDKDELRVAKAVNKAGLADIHGVPTPEQMDAIYGALVMPHHKNEAEKMLGKDADPDKIKQVARELAKKENGRLENIGRSIDAARAIRGVKEMGLGDPIALDKKGTMGFHAGVGNLEALAGHLGALKLDGKTQQALQAHREMLSDASERAKTIIREQNLQYIPGHRSDDPAEINVLPSKIRSQLVDPDTGKENGDLYFTRPQEQFMERFADTGRLINGLGVGNGKTMSSMGAVELLKKRQGENGPKKTLVVVPGRAQMKAWLGDHAKMMQGSVMSSEGNIHPDADYHVVTTAALSNEARDANGQTLVQRLRDHGFDSGIVDEAHTLNSKNAPKKSSQRKAVMAMLHGHEHAGLGLDAHAPMKAIIGATGTPMQNHPDELHGMVDLIHHNQHDLGDLKSFQSRYVEKRAGKTSGLKAGKQIEDELGGKLSQYMHRSTPQDLDKEFQPPTPSIETVGIDATHDKVQPWRLKRDETGNPVHGPDGKPVFENHGKAESMVDMLTRHHNEIHSLGGDQLISGDEMGREHKDIKGALHAISNAERDVLSIKEPHIENHIRKILSENPEAKIGAFSGSREGQAMMHRVFSRVFGDFNAAGPEYQNNHYQGALKNLQTQRDEAAGKHAAHVKMVGHQVSRLHALRESGVEDLAKNPAAKERMDKLVQRMELRHNRLSGLGDGHHAEALDRAIANSKQAIGSRLGYTHAAITDEATEGERDKVIGRIAKDGSLKGVTLSQKMASTGLNAGQLTHLLDVDGNYNIAQLEQMYARHARLTGSVPTSKVAQFHVKAPEGAAADTKTGKTQLRSIDEKKAFAAESKRGVNEQVTRMTRGTAPAGAAKIAKVGRNEFGDAAIAKPKKRAKGAPANIPDPEGPGITHNGSDLDDEHWGAADAAMNVHRQALEGVMTRAKTTQDRNKVKRAMKAAEAVHDQVKNRSMESADSWHDLHQIANGPAAKKMLPSEQKETLAKIREHAETLKDQATFDRAKKMAKSMRITMAPRGVFIRI